MKPQNGKVLLFFFPSGSLKGFDIYASVYHEGTSYRAGDFCLLQGEDANKFFVARIDSLYHKEDGEPNNMCFDARWYYQVQDLPESIGKSYVFHEREVLQSEHIDINNIHDILKRARVFWSLAEYEKFMTSTSNEDERKCAFYCARAFNHKKKKVIPLSFHITSDNKRKAEDDSDSTSKRHKNGDGSASNSTTTIYKRPRGRPRKEESKKMLIKPIIKGSENAPPKRPRGRPRKIDGSGTNTDKTKKNRNEMEVDSKTEDIEPHNGSINEPLGRRAPRKSKSPKKAHPSSSELDPACLDTFDELVKTNKTRYIIYNMIADVDKNVKFVVEHIGPAAVGIDDFIANLPVDGCRESVYKVADGKKNSVVLVSWVPEESATKNRKIHSAHADELKLKFEGLTNEIVASDKNSLQSQLQKLQI